MRGGGADDAVSPRTEDEAAAVVHDKVAPAADDLSLLLPGPRPSLLARRAASALKCALEALAGVRTERTRLGEVGELGRRPLSDVDDFGRCFLDEKREKRLTIVGHFL